VGDAALLVAGVNISATEGALFSGTVSTFVDPAGSEAVADYTATINWGAAGTGSTQGTIVDDGGGHFHVTGSYTYAEEGSPTVQVTLTHDALPAVSASSSTATVADAQLSNATGKNSVSTEGVDTGTFTFATFSDLGGPEAAGDYSATIDWGDGKPAGVGAIVPNLDGSFSVEGATPMPTRGPTRSMSTLCMRTASRRIRAAPPPLPRISRL
jgi:hypothetical protein